MNRDDVIDVLEVVAAATRRTFGEADLAIWHPVIRDVPVQFAREAVIAHLKESPGVWLEPGHIFQRWRDHRRYEAMAESREQREARQEALSAKAAEDIEALAERKGIPTPHAGPSFRRGVGQTPKAIACPWCNARPTTGCIEPNSGKPLKRSPFHPARIDAWNARNPHAQYARNDAPSDERATNEG